MVVSILLSVPSHSGCSGKKKTSPSYQERDGYNKRICITTEKAMGRCDRPSKIPQENSTNDTKQVAETEPPRPSSRPSGPRPLGALVFSSESQPSCNGSALSCCCCDQPQSHDHDGETRHPHPKLCQLLQRGQRRPHCHLSSDRPPYSRSASSGG
jgi:hypothetical protein